MYIKTSKKINKALAQTCCYLLNFKRNQKFSESQRFVKSNVQPDWLSPFMKNLLSQRSS